MSGDGPESDPSQPEPTWIGTKRAQEIAPKGGDGGSGGMGLESRVARLEAFVETSQADLREMRGDMKAMIATLGLMPKKSDLDSWKWQWLAASVAIFAVVVGSIIGGLSILKP